MARKLTDRQRLFLEYLFHPDVNGNAAQAKLLAGYSENVATSSIVDSLKEEVLEATRNYLVSNGPKAAIKLANVLDNPTAFSKELLAASKEVLDRIGVVKTEKVEIVSSGVLIAPPKD